MERERVDHTAPLHTMNPTSRFGARAEDYKKFRPSYPGAAIDAVLDGLGEAGRVVAADVGAGTGISSRLLAEKGVRVIAVEPNAAMREAAEAHGLVEWRDGTAEATGLRDGEVDLVVCAQAFHWFEPVGAVREFWRVLKRGGRLALVWNSRDNRDDLTRGYVEAIRTHGGEHPAERRPFRPDGVSETGLFTPLRLFEVPSEQALDEEGLLGRAASASYVPKAGPDHDRLMEALRVLHRAHRGADGMVRLRYITQVWTGDRVG
ncbi:MAG: class I SAM-dependent methyltransferase [Phycisphaeraceae bacterium]|nr:class I SAM-dependent methyltransferase [Phycisphaeraceae bacterium]